MAKGSKKIGTMGSKIMAEAQKIRAKQPTLAWTKCVAKAGKTLNFLLNHPLSIPIVPYQSQSRHRHNSTP